MTKKKAFTLIELLVVISIIALLIGILLPALGVARRTARQMQNSTQVRGIHQGMVTFAQGNNTWFPGLNGQGTGLSTAGNTGDYDYTGSETPIAIENVAAIMLNGNYFTPEYLISPGETVGTIVKAATGAVNPTNSSYAILSVNPGASGSSAAALRKNEWRDTINSEAVAVSDRGNAQSGDDGGLNTTSIWVSDTGDATTSPTQWRGSVAWNDNHTTFETSAVLPNTKFGTVATTNDNLFTGGTCEMYR